METRSRTKRKREERVEQDTISTVLHPQIVREWNFGSSNTYTIICYDPHTRSLLAKNREQFNGHDINIDHDNSDDHSNESKHKIFWFESNNIDICDMDVTIDGQSLIVSSFEPAEIAFYSRHGNSARTLSKTKVLVHGAEYDPFVLDRRTNEGYVYNQDESEITCFSVKGTVIRKFPIESEFTRFIVVGEYLWVLMDSNEILILDKRDGKLIRRLDEKYTTTLKIETIVNVGALVGLMIQGKNEILFLRSDGSFACKVSVGEFAVDYIVHAHGDHILVSGYSGGVYRDNNRVKLVRLRKVAAISFLMGLHRRVGICSAFAKVAKRCTIFDIQALRIPLRLAGAAFKF